MSNYPNQYMSPGVTQISMFAAQAIDQVPAVAMAGQIKIPTTGDEVKALIYPNGGGQPPHIVFHEDGGHGWLQVPCSLIAKMGIGGKITGYSYRRGEFAYLEEDCDLSTFVQALKLPENNLMPVFWSICPKEYKDHSPIRNYSRYKK